MGLRQLTASGAWRYRSWSVAPVLAMAAAIAVVPCDCPDHTTGHGSTHAQVAAPQPAAHAARSDVAQQGSATDHSTHGSPMAFEVGSPARPIVTRGASGPLWKASRPNAPGSTKHGTFAAQVVAAQLEQLRQPVAASTTDPVAQRALLTTAQATKKLSKRCQRLIRADRSDLTRRDKRDRLRCVRDRRTLVAKANTPAPGVTAPSAPVQGPTPTTAPPTATDPATPTAPTPAPTTPTTTPTKKYAAAGVIATDGLDPFRLTRSSATADVVNFELDNTDRQAHDLYIAPADADGAVNGPLVKVIGRIEGGTRESADVELAPGRYKLLCTVPGHGPMTVNFTVYAPPAA